ncbi:MAG: alpha/beta hydrolase [Bryobacteraceae bacterium]
MRKTFSCLLLVSTGLYGQQSNVIKVWPGKAPGSENWTFSERITEGPDGGKTYSNVSDPTLTIYLPEPGRAKGAAVILCPGGGMRALSFPEPERTAAWLNDKGIAAFILKYRVVPDVPQTSGAGPSSPRRPSPPQRGPELSFKEIQSRRGNANPAPGDAEQARVIAMAIADAQQAIRLLRSKAAEYRIDPKRIGILGFSAGGGVAIGTALAEASDAYPDFVATVYGPSLVDVNVPAHGAPLFIAVMDGHFNVTNGCAALFTMWKEAGRPVEMHVYDHGYGPASGMPVVSWIERLHDWLRARRLVTD